MQVLRGGLAVIVALPIGGVSEPAQVYRKDAVPRREKRNQLVKRPPCLGESMDQQDRRSARSCGDIMKRGSIDFYMVVPDSCLVQ